MKDFYISYKLPEQGGMHGFRVEAGHPAHAMEIAYEMCPLLYDADEVTVRRIKI